MDFHPPSYYKCPTCETIVSYMAASSMNNFGSTLYSDGYERGMMFFHYQDLVKCSKCKTFYWRNMDNYLGEGFDKAVKNLNYGDFPGIGDLSINDIKQAIKKEVYTDNDQEKYLREQLWWRFNDRVRQGKALFVHKTDEKLYTENCLELMRLYDRNSIDQLFLIAELNRNIGDFAACKIILKAIPVLLRNSWEQGKSFYMAMLKLMLRECNKKNTFVIMVKCRGEVLKRTRPPYKGTLKKTKHLSSFKFNLDLDETPVNIIASPKKSANNVTRNPRPPRKSGEKHLEEV